MLNSQHVRLLRRLPCAYRARLAQAAVARACTLKPRCTLHELARGGELLHLGEHVEEAAVAAGRERLREPARLDQPGLTRVGQ